MDQSTIDSLRELFLNMYGEARDRKLLLVVSPGRTEIAGNHTDHEGGHVIAGAVNRYITGIFSPSESGVLSVHSEGYGLVRVDAENLEPREDEFGSTTSLVRGMAAQFAKRGYELAGFDAVVRSEVLGGSGISSSAAFELELGQAMNALWANGEIGAAELALMAQTAEREWFGKPCGLMDQASVALGGIQHMDFSDSSQLKAEAIDFDFGDAGYAICIVAVGADHSALTSEYAAVPGEMQAVARELGHGILSEVTMSDVMQNVPALREKLGDRAVLRALHYFHEEQLVADRVRALREKDIERFLSLERFSGISSAMLLQNVSVGGSASQPSMLAIAVAEGLLGGRGVARVHGGGFGGTIQAFVPNDAVADFCAGMDEVFGEGACGVYGIDREGARSQWL